MSVMSAQRYTAILTRPAGQSETTANFLREAGIGVLDFPLIDIKGLGGSSSAGGSSDMAALAAPTDLAVLTALDKALCDVQRFSLIFFVSPNAIEQAFLRAAVIGVPLAANLRGTTVAVVGPGSVMALQAVGVTTDTHRVLAPDGALLAAANQNTQQTTQHERIAPDETIRYDSEALLAALDREIGRETLRDQSVLVIRGEGGRELFADALRDAGAKVEALSAYRRLVPQPSHTAWVELESLLDLASAAAGSDDEGSQGKVHDRVCCWVLSSSEGVRNLKTLVDQRFAAPGDAVVGARYKALFKAPVFVPHPRIAAAASSVGFDTITNAGAGDQNLVRAILAASERNGKHPA